MKNIDILYGMILGDGSLRRTQYTSYFETAHHARQLEYLEHKSDLLRSIGFRTTLAQRPNSPYHRLWTSTDKIWDELRAELYCFRVASEKMRKRITKDILRKCSLITLLYWYLDDGSNRKDRKGIVLSTCDFPQEEQELIRDWIFDLTGAEMRIWHKMNKQRGKSYPCLGTHKDADIFKNALISVFPDIECMKYKLI